MGSIEVRRKEEEEGGGETIKCQSAETSFTVSLLAPVTLTHNGRSHSPIYVFRVCTESHEA